MLLYVDTGALIALAVPKDKHHARAKEVARARAVEGDRFVLGRPVLVEFLDGFTKKVGKREAIEQLHNLESSPRVRIEPETEADFSRARELFVRYDDEEIDLTDSLSFAIMDRLGLKEAFTFDPDFETHGLTRIA